MSNHQYTTVPNPPEHLSEEARQTWYKAGLKLVKENRMNEDSLNQLANLCYWEEQKVSTLEKLRALQSSSDPQPGKNTRSITLKNLKAIKEEVKKVRSELNIEQNESGWITETQPFSDEVYTSLPAPLLACCDCLPGALKKDLFLLTCLPSLSAFLPNIVAEHADGYYSTSVNLFLIDNSGSGDTFSKKITTNFESNRRENKTNAPRFFSSFSEASRSMYEQVSGFWNRSNAIYELNPQSPGDDPSEDDLAVISQEKLFRHSFVLNSNVNRKSDPIYTVSTCVIGDADQYRVFCSRFDSLIRSSFLVYCGEMESAWQSHRPDSSTRALNQQVGEFQFLLGRLNAALLERSKPLVVELTDNQWQMIDDTFAEKMDIIEELALPPALQAANEKAAIYSLKLSAMFAALRRFDERRDIIRDSEYITPDDNDVVASLWIVDTCLKHTIRAFEHLPLQGKSDARGERYHKFYHVLPPEFETADAIELAGKMGIADRTAKRYLNVLLDEKKLSRIRRGRYEKVG